MVEWLKSGRIAMLGPCLEKMARATGMGRRKLAAVMQSNCHQNKGVYQRNQIKELTPLRLPVLEKKGQASLFHGMTPTVFRFQLILNFKVGPTGSRKRE